MNTKRSDTQVETDTTEDSAIPPAGKSGRRRLTRIITVVLATYSFVVSVVLVGVIIFRRSDFSPTPVAVESQGLIPTQKVWVALQPISRGSGFAEGSLGIRDWPTTNIPPDVIADVSETIGTVAASNIAPGQAIQRSRLMVHTAWEMSASPTISDNVAYFGRNDGALYAVDTQTGERIWHLFPRFDPEKGTPASWAISTPAVEDKVVYFVAGGTDILHAVNTQTGLEEWRFESTESVATMNPAPPTVADDVVYFGSNGDRSLYAVDVEAGTEKWHLEIGGTVASAPVVANGVVYFVSSDRHFYAVDAETGQEKWNVEL
jgi:hypothetical protein